MRLKSGMNVRVVSGNHKGKEGKILKILKNKNATTKNFKHRKTKNI